MDHPHPTLSRQRKRARKARADVEKALGQVAHAVAPRDRGARPRAAPVLLLRDGPDRGRDQPALRRRRHLLERGCPCNIALSRQAQSVKSGVAEAGGTPREFTTITVTDGIAMGHQGMKSSLVSREVIADSVELTVRGHCYDALVGLAGCDKSLPGMMMAMLRLNVPAVFMYGGSILPGNFRGRDVTVVDVFEAVGQHAAGNMSDADLHELECVACPSSVPTEPGVRRTKRTHIRCTTAWTAIDGLKDCEWHGEGLSFPGASPLAREHAASEALRKVEITTSACGRTPSPPFRELRRLLGPGSLTVDQFVDRAARLGYDGVMLMAKRPHLSLLDYPSRMHRELRARLERLASAHVVPRRATPTSPAIGAWRHPTIGNYRFQYVAELARLARRSSEASSVRIFTGYENPAAAYSGAQWRVVAELVRESRSPCGGVWESTLGVQNHHDIACRVPAEPLRPGPGGQPSELPRDVRCLGTALHGVDLTAAASKHGAAHRPYDLCRTTNCGRVSLRACVVNYATD